MIEDLLELETTASARAEAFLKDVTFLKDLTALVGQPSPYRPALKDGLLHVIADLEALAAAAERLPADLPPMEAQACLATVGRVLQTWGEINAAIDRAVALSLRGGADRGFQLLSPIANNANLRGRRRLLQIRDRLADLAARAAAPPPPPRAEEEEVTVDLPPSEFPPKREPPGGPAIEPGPPPRLAGTPASPGPGLDYSFLFVESSLDADEEKSFQTCLARLAGADELDRNEALVAILSRYQPELVAGLIRGAVVRDEELERILNLLWRNAEMVLLEDYFFSARRTKLTSFLAMAEPYPAAGLFRKLLDLFRPRPNGYPAVAEALTPIEQAHEEELTVFRRALLVHPIEEYRRYAVSRLDPSEYWSVISFPQAPIAALADILDRMAQADVSDDHRKVFFDCTLKTLEEARGGLELKAARRVLNTLFTFEFFMEDDYFQKLIRLAEALEQEEGKLGIENVVFQRSLAILKAQKDEVGSKATLPPSFTGIPLALQRRLAREGHYLLLFVRHPNSKIALETVRFINTAQKAEQVARIATVNSLVLVDIAKKEDLFRSQAARLALLSNPRAPILAAQKYVPLMQNDDLKRLAYSRDINPEIANYVRLHLSRKGVATQGRPLQG